MCRVAGGTTTRRRPGQVSFDYPASFFFFLLLLVAALPRTDVRVQCSQQQLLGKAARAGVAQRAHTPLPSAVQQCFILLLPRPPPPPPPAPLPTSSSSPVRSISPSAAVRSACSTSKLGVTCRRDPSSSLRFLPSRLAQRRLAVGLAVVTSSREGTKRLVLFNRWTKVSVSCQKKKKKRTDTFQQSVRAG